MKFPGKRLKYDNRGSGIITVLVAVFFILVLGSTLLFSAYTGYMIKVSERKSGENFYSAETVMDEIRAGLQQAVSESVSKAYSSILVEYSSLVQAYSADNTLAPSLNDYIENQFRTAYLNELLAWKYDSSSLFNSVHSTYDVSVLDKFVSRPENVALTGGNGDAPAVGSFQLDSSSGDLTLKAVTVDFTLSGYETEISTDIVIHTPPFSYTPAEYSLTNLNRLTLVANNALTHTADANAAVTGDVYAGSVVFGTYGLGLTYSGGIFTCAGDFGISNQAAFTMNNATLWAEGITVGDNSLVNLSGTVNIADDLTFSGSNARIVLGSAGTDDQYNGFGYLSGANGSPADSSSIIVNGRSNSLDMSNLDVLTLAGNSFIQAVGDTAVTNYAMGQSIATRSDQLAYLVPVSCLPVEYPSNPCYNETAVSSDTTQAILNNIHALASSSGYEYYADVDGVSALYTSVSSIGENALTYFFMTFDTVEHANAFFSGYFAQNSSEINSYLTAYLSNYSAAQNVLARGGSYVGTLSSGSLQLKNALTASWESQTASYRASFLNLCKKLSVTAISQQSDPSAYDYLVNSGAISDLIADGGFVNHVAVFKDDSGNILGKIVDGDYTISQTETAKVIICTGNVTVQGNFSGLIIAKGNIDIGANVNSSIGVSTVLQAKNDSGSVLLDFLNIGSGTGSSTGADTEGTTWDLDDLVVYTNWEKY